MLQRTNQLRVVKQQITKREEANYNRYFVEVLQQLWEDPENKQSVWKDIPVIESKND